MTAVQTPALPPASEFLITGEGIEAVGEGAWLLRGQGNSVVFEVPQGLVVVDTGPGGRVTAGMIAAVRGVSQAPLHALCFSHGHIGYNTGLPQWLEHARARGEPVPRVVAQANVPRRLARYAETMPLQEQMAEIQFRRGPGAFRGKFPVQPPSEAFEEELLIGEPDGRHVRLVWAPSETDDAIAAWYPAAGVLYGGPAVIDSIPNVGTPFRTMRDPVRWAATLDRLAALDPALVVREFGSPLAGRGQVQQVLGQTAKALRWVRAEVVRLMNLGYNERQVLDAIRFPDELFGAEWMQATYGDPHWIARDVYRSENGWWDRNPTQLHPAPLPEAGRAVADAITDKQGLLDHARRLADAGHTQLALHVVDVLACLHCDDPAVREARRLKAAWLLRRASESKNFISKSVYHAASQMLEHGDMPRFGMA